MMVWAPARDRCTRPAHHLRARSGRVEMKRSISSQVMRSADLRFYAELRDFLSSDRRSGTVTRFFDVAGSVKDMIEACGVPHTEVDVILANGIAVDFSY